MNQTLDIAARILASLVIARPTGNPDTQAIDALNRAVALIDEAQVMGLVATYPPEGFTPPEAPAEPARLSFGAKRSKK
jgi:hypothetical protein